IYGDVSAFNLAKAIASGGNGLLDSQKGGAGTIYVKGPTAVFGDLIIVNGAGIFGVARTILPTVGQTRNYDNAIAHNNSHVISYDEVQATFSVDATSYFATPSRDVAPTISMTTIPDSRVLFGHVLEVDVPVSDDNEVDHVDLVISGALSFSQTQLVRTKGRTVNFFYAVPMNSTPGDVSIVATVTDAFGRTASVSKAMTTGPDLPPTGTLTVTPPTTVLPGGTVNVRVDASDDEQINFMTIHTTGLIVGNDTRGEFKPTATEQ